MSAPPQIAILGWGSLVWRPGQLRLRRRFRPEGSTLTVEFSRRSDRGRLTLVIDRRGNPVVTYAALSDQPTLDEAVEDLRAREGARVRREDVGVAKPNEVVNARDADAGRAIGAWTAEKKLDATIWTDLESEWPEFDLANAVAHLHGLNDADREHARVYFANSPAETDTPLRRHLARWIAGGALPA